MENAGKSFMDEMVNVIYKYKYMMEDKDTIYCLIVLLKLSGKCRGMTGKEMDEVIGRIFDMEHST